MPRIRRRWLARRLVELALFGGLMLFLVDQYVEPAILNSLQPLQGSNPVLVMERVLKLSLPCMYVWLCMFYIFFHLWLNILAELTRFADREFYRDWWNARTIGEYWRLWNMPVHRWMVKCVHTPLQSLGALWV
jgi:diacylglycerol O-acyltransferase 1